MASKVAEMAASLGWGALAASSLVIGAFLASVRHWPPRQVGFVLAFGAGALISAVSFELAQEGFELGGTGVTAIGLGVGALTYYGLDGLIARHQASGRGRRGRAQGDDPGTALALGAFLDGIPWPPWSVT
jgi:ZIP family zinc transporter